MNTTISNPTFDSNWKRSKGQYVAAACGLALAAAALTGVGSGGNGGTAGTTFPASRASTSLVVPQRGPSQHTIVLAASEQQMIDQRASLLQDVDPSWYAAYTFIVASNHDQEAFAQYAIAEALREDGVSLQVLDLRTAPAAGLVQVLELRRSLAIQPMFGSAADAEYAAHSLNQLPALPSLQAVQPMFGTAADAEMATQSLR